MKKLGKILLVMAIAAVFVFAMMTVASAATIADITASVATDEGRTITVDVTYESPEAAQQSTILVVPSGTSIAELEDSSIKYINQEAVSDTTITYTFKLLEADRSGSYDVYVGGTGVDAPGNTAFSFEARQIIGTISVLGDATKATAVATSGDTSTSGTVASDGTYTITVGQGTYDVVLGKAGYLYKTYSNVTVADANVDLGAMTLLAGDVTGDGVINIFDLQEVLSSYLAANESIDLDDNEVINIFDLQAVLSNYLATTASYDN